MDVISVMKLTKKYNQFTVIDGITFHVRKGELFGMIVFFGAYLFEKSEGV